MRPRPILQCLGEEVRTRRKRRGLTQQLLARQAGVSTNLIGSLERGKYNITLEKLHRVAAKLDGTLLELFASAVKRQ